MSSALDNPALQNSLRERKKVKTRKAIQDHALRLFRERGYAATTVEQIAEAAEVSPSTFFRYFPSKEEVVLQDDYDPMLAEVFRSLPAEMNIVTALRTTFKTVFSSFPPEEVEAIRERMRLMSSIPELQNAVLGNANSESAKIFTELAMEKLKLPAGDLKILVLSAAIRRILVVVITQWALGNTMDLPDVIDKSLEYLETGFKL